MSTNSDNEYQSAEDLFEQRMELFKEDPERFEEERCAEVEKAISLSMPENQERLRRLQWRIDIERKRAKNPMDSAVRLSKIMWNYFYSEHGFYVAINSFNPKFLS